MPTTPPPDIMTEPCWFQGPDCLDTPLVAMMSCEGIRAPDQLTQEKTRWSKWHGFSGPVCVACRSLIDDLMADAPRALGIAVPIDHVAFAVSAYNDLSLAVRWADAALLSPHSGPWLDVHARAPWGDRPVDYRPYDGSCPCWCSINHALPPSVHDRAACACPDRLAQDTDVVDAWPYRSPVGHRRCLIHVQGLAIAPPVFRVARIPARPRDAATYSGLSTTPNSGLTPESGLTPYRKIVVPDAASQVAPGAQLPLFIIEE